MNMQLDKLTSLLNVLLDLLKRQAGTLTRQKGIMEDMQGTIIIHHISINERADIPITGNRDRLGQVLINLLMETVSLIFGRTGVKEKRPGYLSVSRASRSLLGAEPTGYEYAVTNFIPLPNTYFYPVPEVAISPL